MRFANPTLLRLLNLELQFRSMLLTSARLMALSATGEQKQLVDFIRYYVKAACPKRVQCAIVSVRVQENDDGLAEMRVKALRKGNLTSQWTDRA